MSKGLSNDERSEKEVFPPIFEHCVVFSFLARRNWKLELYDRFPKLTFLMLNIESSECLPKVQKFFDHNPQLRMLNIYCSFYDINNSNSDLESSQQQSLKLTLPPNLEILRLGMLKKNPKFYH